MADGNVKKANTFVSRFRGHEIVDGVSQADLGVTVGNIVYGAAGFGLGAILKRTAFKNTKLGKFSILKSFKNKNKEDADNGAQE